nr:hypothetical protein [Mesorhizobium loti]
MAVAFSSTSGIAYPEDLTFLTSVYDDICFRRGFHRGSRAAEDVGKVVMVLFTQGIHNENEIRESVERHLGHKSPAGELLRV